MPNFQDMTDDDLIALVRDALAEQERRNMRCAICGLPAPQCPKAGARRTRVF